MAFSLAQLGKLQEKMSEKQVYAVKAYVKYIHRFDMGLLIPHIRNYADSINTVYTVNTKF